MTDPDPQRDVIADHFHEQSRRRRMLLAVVIVAGAFGAYGLRSCYQEAQRRDREMQMLDHTIEQVQPVTPTSR